MFLAPFFPWGGLQSAPGAEFPYKNVLDQMNYNSPNKAEYLFVDHIISQVFRKIKCFFMYFYENFEKNLLQSELTLKCVLHTLHKDGINVVKFVVIIDRGKNFLAVLFDTF